MVFAVIGGISAYHKNRVPVLHQLSKVYISFFRGVPTLVQLFLIYYYASALSRDEQDDGVNCGDYRVKPEKCRLPG